VIIAIGGYLLMYDSEAGGVFDEKPLMGDLDPLGVVVGQ
jgi:hypothetical protein